MNRFALIFLPFIFLAACASEVTKENPFNNGDDSDVFDDDSGSENDDGGSSGGDGGITSDRELPPGTDSPEAKSGISRSEARSDDAIYSGNGYAESIAYNSTSDRFYVDNLGFDGDNFYGRGPDSRVSSLGPTDKYAVYEASNTFTDAQTGKTIQQLTAHRAIYRVSASGNTEMAIVRTGAYTGYGFGGFVYERHDDVVLPTVAGQASFTGEYAGFRDFVGRAAIEYVQANMTLDIDFEDFNESSDGLRGAAVKARIYNREIFDVNGNDLKQQLLDGLVDTRSRLASTTLPEITFTIGPNVLDTNGEIIGSATSTMVTNIGPETFMEGKYYAILSGDLTDGANSEIVGIVVVEGDYELNRNVTVRETGGFILNR